MYENRPLIEGQTVNDNDISSAVGLFHIYARGLVHASVGIKNQEIALKSLGKARNLKWQQLSN